MHPSHEWQGLLATQRTKNMRSLGRKYANSNETCGNSLCESTVDAAINLSVSVFRNQYSKNERLKQKKHPKTYAPHPVPEGDGFSPKIS